MFYRYIIGGINLFFRIINMLARYLEVKDQQILLKKYLKIKFSHLSLRKKNYKYTVLQYQKLNNEKLIYVAPISETIRAGNAIGMNKRPIFMILHNIFLF